MRIRGKTNQTRCKRIRPPQGDISSSHPKSRSRPKTFNTRESRRAQPECRNRVEITKSTIPTSTSIPEVVVENKLEQEPLEDAILDDDIGDVGDNNGDLENEEDDTTEPSTTQKPSADNSQRKVKHIHPCVCDLSEVQRNRIKAHLEQKEEFESRYLERLEEIDLERLALEEEIRRKEDEAAEHEELFGDQYEVVGKKKKRIKRSARRVSMVSLGVKQIIAWKKSPKIKVKLNKVSELRKTHHSYCGRRHREESPQRKIVIDISPKIPVRATRAFSLRSETNRKKSKELISKEDRKRPFVFSHYLYAS